METPAGPKGTAFRRYAFFALKLLVGAALVGYMVGRGHLSGRSLANAWQHGRAWLAASLAAIVFVPIVGGVRWWLMMRAQGLHVSLRASMRLTYIGAFFNTFMPGATGGDVIRMYGAAAGFPERRTAAVLTVFADRAAGFFSLGLLAILVLLFNHDAILKLSLVKQAVVILFVSMALFFALICIVLSKRLRSRRQQFLSRPGRVRDTLRKVDEALGIYRGRRRVLVAAILLSLLAHLFSIVTLFGASRAIGEISIPFRRYLFLVPLALAVNSIPLSPGGVGQGEGFAEALFKSVGSASGAEAFLVYRVVMMLGWLPGLVLYLMGSVKFQEMVAVEKAAEEELAHLTAVPEDDPDSASHG